MGIFGALSTAVTGLRAQAFALENISGNISNSQTVGFKRIDTDFRDLIPDAPQKRQPAGSVIAQSRSTNNVQGDVKSSSTETFMAINGNGMFVVEPSTGQADGSATFSGANYYTRRGDFTIDKSGYLVNGSGYYLKGLEVDPKSQNVTGAVPQVLRISSAFQPAEQTTRVNYEVNLAQLPKTSAYKTSQKAGSELLNSRDFLNLTPDTAALTTGGTTSGTAAASTIASAGDTLQITIGGVNRTYTFNAGGSTTLPAINVNDAATDTVQEVLATIQADLRAQGANGAEVGLDANNKIYIKSGNITDPITVRDSTNGSNGTGFNLADATTGPTVSDALALTSRVNTIAANQTDAFFNQTISGGAVTVYASNGAPANVQMRWAKVNSTPNGGADRWNLYIQTNSDATGTQTAWTRVGGDYSFGSNGAPNPAIEYTDLSALTVNGVNVGTIRLQFGPKGLTQFADANGGAEVTTLSQNGYPAGQFTSVNVNDKGRIVVAYSNGQQLEIAQVVTANFQAVNQLKRMDGGVFAATSDSGEPILDNGGTILGSSLESSNTDISEEFTKLIVSQQAYAAGTKVVSTSDQMLQDALNMIR